MAAVDVSQEKKYLLVGVVLVLLSFLPKYGTVLGVVGLVLQYLGFKGYEEKLGLSEPRKDFLLSVITGIIGLAIVFTAFFLVVFTTAGLSAVENGGSTVSVGPITTYYGTTSTVISTVINGTPEVGKGLLASVALFVLGIWVTMAVSVYYSTKAFLALGEYFGVEEFKKYRTFALAAWLPLPLWIALIVVGWVVFIVLDIVSIVYLIMGVDRLPEKYEKKDELYTSGPSPVIY